MSTERQVEQNSLDEVSEELIRVRALYESQTYMIQKLIQTSPNDDDLGRAVRKLFNNEG